ncbi:MAG: type II toxin-antitoxin system HipA family toxin [Rhodospirillales bacterium]|nr:type II toxin-antitoxin system HipA family toxin [Alphaproteobacteria bacterium]USO05713.1 MAG: type II toxin-antitoxin system HipA family toxin [Rhodospirillales bacterium]HOO49738.1 type II toxin-antitoxin system HipA family toxin [Alphaproteobacteria bacterium]
MTKNFTPVSALNVMLDFGDAPIPVGRLAHRDGKIFFEYDADFITKKLEVSPFKLPLTPELQVFEPGLFEGLPGLFNDSLPDGWGRLLLDRALRRKGIAPDSFSPLDRLAYVGASGMGALIYAPDYSEGVHGETVNLDVLADQSQAILEGSSEEVFEELLALGGSPQGARPKAMIGVNRDKSKVIQGVEDLPTGYEPWLVKFANTADGQDAGAIEYVYSLMAQEAGLEVMDAHLFPAKTGAGYFATKRFDRTDSSGRLHMHTACGLLHSDFRVPSLDYQDLIKATMILTRDIREAQKMYRLAVFNVLSHNRDDHAKNFSFLMDDSGTWKMAPAYDLTFSSGPGGEQSTMVMGEGKNPGVEQLLKLAEVADLSRADAQRIIDETVTVLQQWKELAKSCGVSKANIKRIKEIIC